MKTDHKIIIGDSRQMEELDDESIHLAVTSPPYWQLKDYGHSDQIGFDDSYEDYINNLNLVWSECYRVLQAGCRLCVNIGDQFARAVYYGRYKIIPIRTEIIKFCETIGFDYMGAIIWQKVTTVNTTGGASIMGSYPHPRNGIVKLDYEFILLFKKLGKPPKVSKHIKEQSKLTREEWNEYFYGHWNFPGEKQEKHQAVFPEELPRRLIKMFSFVGDRVLDPFLGSGTTSLAAMNLSRHSVGFEINRSFLPLIRGKLGVDATKSFTNPVDFEIIKRTRCKTDFADRIARMPYVFSDPVRVDKKVDPRKLTFGSNIDGRRAPREDFHSVKDIRAPDLIVLENGLRVRLLGVTPVKEKAAQAIEFLRAATKGKKVYLRFGEVKHGKNGDLLAHVFLKNRMCLNKRLIKQGLASTDSMHAVPSGKAGG